MELAQPNCSYCLSSARRQTVSWLVGWAIGCAILLGCHGELPENVKSLSVNPTTTRQADETHEKSAEETPVEIELSYKAVGFDALVDNVIDKADAATDGWQTEVLSDHAMAQLGAIVKLLKDERPLDEQRVAGLLADDFKCHVLRPVDVKLAFQDGTTTIHRMVDPPESDTPPRHEGGDGFVQALVDLSKGLARGKGLRVKFKVFRVSQADLEFTTDAIYEASCRTSNGSLQQNAVWSCRWSMPVKNSSKPRLKFIELTEFEEVATNTSGPQFVDCTESALGQNPSYAEHILYSYDHWLTRISKLEMMRYMGFHGIAVGDVNGDGLEDTYMCEVGGLPNRLFVQNLDGTFTDRSAAAGVDWLEYSTGALLLDLDNDGDQDLVICTRPFVLVSENNGQGQFELVAKIRSVLDAYTVSAADYDQDGDLDLYITGYLADGVGIVGSPVPYYDANNGGANALLRNDGGLQFVDVTAEEGLHVNNGRFSYAAAWEDFDNDGDLDLYVANDFGRNNLYIRQPDGFVDQAAEAGVEDVASGMSVACGDYNGDGWMDIYVANMYSSAGNRIAFQQEFTQHESTLPREDLQRMARGNTLFANNGDGTFRDVTVQAGVAMGRWAWGSKFADLNNDGWQDIVVTNGFITADNTSDL